MNSKSFVLPLAFLILMGTSLLQIQRPLRIPHAARQRVMDNARLRVVESYGKLPLNFEANLGQTDGEVKFLSRGGGYNLFLTATEAVVELKKSEIRRNPQIAPITQIKESEPEQKMGGSEQSASSAKSAAVLRMKLVGANASARIEGADELPGKSNYFIGNDPSKWRTNVPTYAKVRYENIYPGSSQRLAFGVPSVRPSMW